MRQGSNKKKQNQKQKQNQKEKQNKKRKRKNNKKQKRKSLTKQENVSTTSKELTNKQSPLKKKSDNKIKNETKKEKETKQETKKKTQKEKETEKEIEKEIEIEIEKETEQEKEKETKKKTEKKTEKETEKEQEKEQEKETENEKTEKTEKTVKTVKKKTFASLGLIPELVQAVEKVNWVTPTAIQSEAIPWALKGRDIIGLAQTGSGKTGAFILPILQSLLKKPSKFFACCVSPTRELAEQISKDFRSIGSSFEVKVTCLYGGVSLVKQAISLAKSPHIIVATPGRLVDHLTNTGGFNLKALKYLVLDEADKLLTMDFGDEIDFILKNVSRKRTTYLYSATMTNSVAKLQRTSLTKPIRVKIANKWSTVDTLVQQYIFIPEMYKNCYLVYFLNEHLRETSIVFTTTCRDAQLIAILLRTLGIECVPLHGKMQQSRRLAALNRFVSKKSKVLIATDVAARGLDINDVDIVINYDLPSSPRTYIHRVGRTARAGKSGLAINFVTQYDTEYLHAIEKTTGITQTQYPIEEKIVLTIFQRVSKAEKISREQLKESEIKRKKRIARKQKNWKESSSNSQSLYSRSNDRGGRKRKKSSRKY
ncbi:hypothetical protein M0812_20948 [Anaeramoeba flamelloides]|uniref:Uncharacterized protein n=1 Tax=Anaeramoeba flamelloides TaxID=1746091 RepID=A0AAV7YT57_9EUKA|nr:hypothetical protein M0812_20948 [Anaeramoeba flamelloides]